MGFDLASKFHDALSILRGNYNIFFPARLGREGLFFYSTALVGKLTGLSRSTLHLTSGLIGVVTIVAVYQLARELFGVGTGLVAAYLLAVNRWHIVLSRSGFRACTMPLFTAWSLYAFLRALRTRRPLDWGLAGVAIGAGAYSYRSFLFVPVALAAGLVLYLLWHWSDSPGLRAGAADCRARSRRRSWHRLGPFTWAENPTSTWPGKSTRPTLRSNSRTRPRAG